MSAKKALIMAGGKGVRLSLIDAPKPLVRVGNKPMIMWAIEQLQEVGVTDIYVAAGDWSTEVQTFLLNEPGITAHVQLFASGDETKRTMNDILHVASDVIGGDFYIVMSDLVIERNPYQFFDALGPLQDDKIITLVDERKDMYEASGARSATVLDHDQVKRIIRDTDEDLPHELGVYYVGKDAAKELARVTEQEGIEKMHDVLQAFADKQTLLAAKLTEGEWFDINTPATHVKAEIFVRERHHALHAVGGIKPLTSISRFTDFHRPRQMQSDIFVERGIIKKLDTLQIIPEELSGSSHIILTDDMVDAHYGEMVESGLKKAGYRVKKIVVPAGEESKNITLFAELADEILAFGIDKQSSIIGLGGGVVNNIAGYLASSLYRGITLIHVPTSSMAQVDAAIDFKQAVNTTYGKNLLGAYHPATNIIIDPEVLLTLDERHLRNGLSESLKHAITQDKAFLQYMMDNADNIWDVPFLEEVVRKTIEHKVPLLNGDVRNDYNEMLPQYGHSLGHAVEHLSGYDLLHGEAIAIGMCLSAEVGLLLGICSEEMVQLHRDVFSAYKLPIVVPDTMTADDIINKIAYDKHYVKGNPQMAIVKDVGDVHHENGVYGIPIEYSLIRKAIERNISR